MTGGDSAGRSWAGRAFEPGAGRWVDDDGSAPPEYVVALAAFRDGWGTLAAVVESLRGARLLVPLLAGLAEADHSGPLVADKRAELSLVTVEGPDGRPVLPAFTSTAAMAAWDASARPIPAPARQIALGAAADGTELVIVDPASTTRFGLRRSALEALARDLPWTPPWDDPDVVAAVRAGVAGERAVAFVRVESGDPMASLEGAEVRVLLRIADGTGAADVVARIESRWRDHEVIRRRVDSIAVVLTPVL